MVINDHVCYRIRLCIESLGRGPVIEKDHYYSVGAAGDRIGAGVKLFELRYVCQLP